MAQLNLNMVKAKLLKESEVSKPKYTTDSVKSRKGGVVGKPMDTSVKETKIKQVTPPAASPKHSEVKSTGGIPTAKMAGEITASMKGPSFKTGSTGEPGKVKVANEKVKTTRPSGVKEKHDRADVIADNMDRGLMTKTGSTGEPGKVKVEKDNIKAKGGEVKTKEPTSKAIPQINFDTKNLPCPSDAPKKATWVSESKQVPVFESVDLIVNGRVKNTFSIISKKVAKSLVENYKGVGVNASFKKTNKVVEWKNDALLKKLILESIDAGYNMADSFSDKAKRKARNRFFSLIQSDYSSLYESKTDFTKTMWSAFDAIMEKADLQYRKSLQVYEGLARVISEGETIDVDVITQARNKDMALRNIHNEIMEDYGVSADVRHIFIDGEKFTPKQIKPWAPK